MNETNETPEPLAAILAEFRAFALRAADEDKMISPESVLLLSDKVEAAAARERVEREFAHKKVEEALADEISIRDEKIKQSAPGNAAAMRDALLSASSSMDIHARIECTEKGNLGKFGNSQSELCQGCRARNCECWQMNLKREVDAALSAPERNCDVGTAEDQEKRFDAFCDSHKWVDDGGVNACPSDCPLYKTVDCALHWAQMPFAPAEGGAK